MKVVRKSIELIKLQDDCDSFKNVSAPGVSGGCCKDGICCQSGSCCKTC